MAQEPTKVRVFTHDGSFHADEVFAIAILELCSKIEITEIVRTRDQMRIDKALHDPASIVIDVGLKHDPKNLNFDHHQEGEVQSSATLVWKHFWNDIPGVDHSVAKTIHMHLLDGIDRWDRGYFNNKPIEILNVCQIINSFNRKTTNEYYQFTQFRAAIEMARIILINEIYGATLFVETQRIWDRKKLNEDETVAYLDEYCKNWRSRGSKENLKMIVWPEDNEFCIASVDSVRYPIAIPDEITPMSPAMAQISFLHPKRWICKVKTRDLAMRIANHST